MNEEISGAEIARLLVAQIAVVLALLLTASALHKVVRFADMRRIVVAFGRVPRRFGPLATASAAAAEFVAAASLLSVPYRAGGGALAAALFAVYGLLILRAIAAGRADLDCGCSLGRSGARLGGYHLARNALLTLLAAAVGLVTSSSGALPISASQCVAAAGALALYAAVEQVMALQPLRKGAIL